MQSIRLSIVLFLGIFFLSSFTATADDITSKIKVNGACGMCKKAIETSLRVKGVSKVNWDKSTLELTVTFNPSKITIDEIHHRVAGVGYDTEKVKATDIAFSKLDECCKYDRSKL